MPNLHPAGSIYHFFRFAIHPFRFLRNSNVLNQSREKNWLGRQAMLASINLNNEKRMAATRVNPKYKKQWQKLMFSFFDYLPMKYEASPREWQVRKLIWDFKDGKRSLQVAELVARKIRETFGNMTEKIVFCCIPASSSEKNVKRYKEFSDEVCRLAGTVNAFDHISVEGERLAVHEYKGAKSVKGVQVISFEEAFFKGAQVLVFDDVVTRGFSYARFACALEAFGASVLGGFFLGRTLLK